MLLAYFLQVDIYWCFVMQFRSCFCKKIFTFHFELKNLPFTQISHTFLSASVVLQSPHQLSYSLTAVLYRRASTLGSSKEMLCFHKIKCFFSFSGFSAPILPCLIHQMPSNKLSILLQTCPCHVPTTIYSKSFSTNSH